MVTETHTMFSEDEELLKDIKKFGTMDRRRKTIKIKRTAFVEGYEIDSSLGTLQKMGFLWGAHDKIIFLTKKGMEFTKDIKKGSI